jgi:hypothetical protein
MKKLIFALFIVSSFYSNAQGVHGGFSGGSQLLKIEAGYSLNENIHVGGYYSLGMDLNAIPLPSSYGVYGRYSFEKSDLFSNDWIQVTARPYVGASVGQIHTNEIVSSTTTLSFPFSSSTSKVTPAKTEMGYLASAGIELLYGSNSTWGTFFEIGVGKAPNYFKAITSTLNSLDSNSTPDGTGTFSFNAGFRFYLQ